MNFPSFPQFCGQFFARAADKDLARVVVQAYNDWHVDEWVYDLSRPDDPDLNPTPVGRAPYGH